MPTITLCFTQSGTWMLEPSSFSQQYRASFRNALAEFSMGWVPQESRCLTNLEWNEMRILGPKCIVFNHWVLYKDKCLLFKRQDWLNSNLVNGWSSKVKLSKFSLPGPWPGPSYYPLKRDIFYQILYHHFGCNLHNLFMYFLVKFCRTDITQWRLGPLNKEILGWSERSELGLTKLFQKYSFNTHNIVKS